MSIATKASRRAPWLGALALLALLGASSSADAQAGGDGAPPVLRSADGAPWRVRSIRRRAAAATYNVSVTETATYFVGAASVLAHNTSPCGGTFTLPPGEPRYDCVACSVGAHYGFEADEVIDLIPELAPVGPGVSHGKIQAVLGRAGLGQLELFPTLPELGAEIVRRAHQGAVQPGDGIIIIGKNAGGGAHAVYGRWEGRRGLRVRDVQVGIDGAAAIDNRQVVGLYALPRVDHGARDMTRLRALSQLGDTF